MKILLIYPYFLEPRIHAEEIAAVPMGLYYVAAMLKSHGYAVELLNWHDRRKISNTIKETLLNHQPAIIGFSILHANRWGGIDIARIAKTLDPSVRIVFGGIGATYLWDHLLSNFAEIDYVVLGEGEYTFLKLVQALDENADRPDLDGILGIGYRKGGISVQTPPAEPILDPDNLPPPARYFDFQHLALTRGCPGRCSFCGSPRYWRRRVRAHSADYFVKQLEMLSARGIGYFYFSDDTFTLKPKRVIDVCRKIIDRGMNISWQAISKVNAVNAEMLQWMRKAGCIQISYGIESGSAKIRQRLCKDIDTDQIERAFRLTVENAILARAYFIYGAPGETWDTIEETLDLIRRIKPLSAIFYILDLFPGTDLYDDFKQNTDATDDIWRQRIEDILYFESDPRLDKETILAFGRRLRGTFQRWLPEFALKIRLPQDENMRREQADFLSRLALTFSHGDYAGIGGRPAPGMVARTLYDRALSLAPDHRAFWGLGLMLQGNGKWQEAEATLQKGLKHHRHSPQLNIAMGVNLTHMGDYRRAMAYLRPFDSAPEALPALIQCCRSMGDANRAKAYTLRLQNGN